MCKVPFILPKPFKPYALVFPFNLHTLSTMYNVHRPSSVDCLVYSSDILAYLFELLNPFDKDEKENRTLNFFI